MCEARERSEWSRMSSLMALTANCHRDPKKSRALKPKDFDPFVKSARPPRVGVEVLKDVFIDGKGPQHPEGTGD
jgi:hypothetical protein